MIFGKAKSPKQRTSNMQSWHNFDLPEFYFDHHYVLTNSAVASFLNFHTNTIHIYETEKSDIIIFPNPKLMHMTWSYSQKV